MPLAFVWSSFQVNYIWSFDLYQICMNSLNRSPTSIKYFDFLNYPSGWLPLQSPPRCYRTHNQLGLPPPITHLLLPTRGVSLSRGLHPHRWAAEEAWSHQDFNFTHSGMSSFNIFHGVGVGYWKRLAFTSYPQNVEIPFPFSQRWLFLREDFCRNISSFCTESHLLWGVDKKWHWLKINGGLSRWRRLLWEKKSVCSAPCGAST